MPRPLLLCLLLTLPIPASAETAIVEATGYGTASNFFEALSGDLQVYKSDFSYDRYEGTEGSRLQIASGRCFGSFTIVRGHPTGSGNCVFVDVNGDKVLQAWAIDAVELGIGHGTWHFVGGTGAHERITGRGYYTNEDVARTGQIKTSINGTVTWPD